MVWGKIVRFFHSKSKYIIKDMGLGSALVVANMCDATVHKRK